MSAIQEKTNKTLAALGIRNGADLGFLWQEVEMSFNSDLARASEQGQWERLRDEWMRSQDAIVNQIERNWVGTANGDLRQSATQGFQNLRAYIAIRLSIFAVMPLEQSVSVADQFKNLRIAFEQEIAGCLDETDLGIGKVAWLGRRFGVLTLVADNWLKPSPPEVKRDVGAELNKLKAHIESKLEEKRLEIKTARQE